MNSASKSLRLVFQVSKSQLNSVKIVRWRSWIYIQPITLAPIQETNLAPRSGKTAPRKNPRESDSRFFFHWQNPQCVLSHDIGTCTNSATLGLLISFCYREFVRKGLEYGLPVLCTKWALCAGDIEPTQRQRDVGKMCSTPRQKTHHLLRYYPPWRLLLELRRLLPRRLFSDIHSALGKTNLWNLEV